MSHSYYHAKSSAKIHGGKWEDFMPLHSWFDETKAHFCDNRHRILRHHSEGIFLAEKIFGPTIKNSNNKDIPTRVLGEQHMIEDFGWIPNVADWLNELPMQKWMYKKSKKLSKNPTLQ